MVIVLDANIFVSAAFWGGIPKAILKMVEDKKDILFITDEIIAEIEDVFQRPKFPATEAEKRYKLQHIKNISRKITVPKSQLITTGGSRDKTDDKYLECGIAANADYIISGDKDLLELKEYSGIKIVTAAEYLDIINGAAE